MKLPALFCSFTSPYLWKRRPTPLKLANARTTYASEAEAYRAIKPVFKTIQESPGVATVSVFSVGAEEEPLVVAHATTICRPVHLKPGACSRDDP